MIEFVKAKNRSTAEVLQKYWTDINFTDDYSHTSFKNAYILHLEVR